MIIPLCAIAEGKLRDYEGGPPSLRPPFPLPFYLPWIPRVRQREFNSWSKEVNNCINTLARIIIQICGTDVVLIYLMAKSTDERKKQANVKGTGIQYRSDDRTHSDRDTLIILKYFQRGQDFKQRFFRPASLHFI
jgi:hypothetical protein